ncbi:hypothetical protein F4780DRAFT_44690 [Xylariomycetidae sp. FL0641]|nr:hypothetical protein F4780DRAFT_44690 [Xylariomycetidae sp. FL0641]
MKMTSDSTRPHDRTGAMPHYTMKTSSRPPLVSSHSHHTPSRHPQSNLQSFRTNRSTTPMTSPRLPHSVGQPYPPSVKLSSPAAAPHARSPSPNYFGLSVENHGELRESAVAPLENWSSSSSVKSFGAAIPKQVPLDANPDFEAFRRQADANRAASFSLGGSHFASASTLRPKPPRRTTNQSDASEWSQSRSPTGKAREPPTNRMDVDTDSCHDSAYVSSDSKRNSEASLHPPCFGGMPRFDSPAQMDTTLDPARRNILTKTDDRHPRLSLPQNKADSSLGPGKPRSETLPAHLEGCEAGLMLTSQLKEILQSAPQKEYLLLDVRVSTHYAQSRIRGALNLCIPTTLLKRATFDLQKLQKTLQIQEDQEKFAQWPEVKHLIVYDASSSEKRDAVSAVNMIKKFTNEGFTGEASILKGGFHAFAAAYPAFVDHQSAAERGGTSVGASEGGRPSFAPVIGGVSLPAAANKPVNPFFSNIRQNMDLADGVGQMDISLPHNIDLDVLPPWLREAAKPADHGKKVSDNFLKIERSEQSRMHDAYAAFNSSNPPSSNSGKIRLSGVEQGVKNRYKDILPFEHARVRLPNRSEGACDYINASHVQASRSHKRYIAAQGPLPATFEDFWSVIWDQDVRVIVMLTAEQEGGQLKCHPYWRGRDFGSIRLKALSEKKISLDIDKHRASSAANSSSVNRSDSGRRRRANTTTTMDPSGPPRPQSQSDIPYVIIRKFALSHASHPFAPIREITHLHFPSWPDFGTPAQPSHLLALVELANVMQRAALPVDAHAVAASVSAEHPATMNWFEEPESDADARPMLVHCSAGCGRTGTFCTVDSVIDMLKRQRLSLLSKHSSHKQDAEGDTQMGGEASASDASTSSDGRKKAKRHDLPGSHESADGKKSIEASWVGDNGLDLIANTVEDFRKQRLSMVQSLRQFVLCYESVIEWVWRLHERTSGGAKGHARSISTIDGRR